jgi:hypothetical protein
VPRPPKPGKCVHCLADPVERNWDHVFPRSWYPDSTPTDLEKWQIPTCVRCNSAYGKLETDFLVRVALCLDPHHPTSASIVENALRSMRVSAGKNARDALMRAARARKMLGEALEGDAIPGHGVYPGMQEKWGRPTSEQIAITIPKASFERITEKIVRGIYYLNGGHFIEPPYKVDFFALDDAGAAFLTPLLERGDRYAREPGLVVRRVAASENHLHSVFEIVLWEQMKMYASVQLAGTEEPSDEPEADNNDHNTTEPEETDMSNKPDPKHLAWAIEQRAEIQRTLLALYEYLRNHSHTEIDMWDKYLLELLVGAAFSLWRAAFLAETLREDAGVHASQEAFLEKLISDNTINFPDDKNNRDWTVEYYLENAKYRLARACGISDEYKKTKLHGDLMKYLRLKGTRGVDLTRYEWESLHFVLRSIFKVIAPDTKLKPVEPLLPR